MGDVHHLPSPSLPSLAGDVPPSTSKTLGDVSLEAGLLEDLLAHIDSIGLPRYGSSDELDSKAAIRGAHSLQRNDARKKVLASLGSSAGHLLRHFAAGREVDPESIDPRIEFVQSDSETGDLFRLATLLWSVPVSSGYGRRLRLLVRDASNGKLIGIAGLADPVFNLRARDQWIGWTAQDRRERLVNVMDAFVLGAVPPYRQLLGGKLVLSLLASNELREEFTRRYAATTGVISKRMKAPALTMLTVSSALGRSSIYNRVKLDLPTGRLALEHVGTTAGYGHFHVSDALFDRLRDLLNTRGHPYGNGHQFGEGPNWRMRVIRAALEELGVDGRVLRHGIGREVYVMPLATNAVQVLVGRATEPEFPDRPAKELGAYALARWVVPRSRRNSDYRRATLLDTAVAMGVVTRE